MPIRLICSDIDGTLLQYDRKELEGEIFEQIRELHRRGILFCPASGRQYTKPAQAFCTGGRLLCVSLRKRRRDL